MTAATNLLAFLGLVATLVVVWRQSWRGRLESFVVQSVVLAALAAVIGLLARRPSLLLVAVLVLVFKAWLIPRILGRIAAGMPRRQGGPGRSVGVSLLVTGGLIVAAYAVLLPVMRDASLPTAGAVPLAFAMALIGLYLCVTGRDALGQILGFLVFENGIFGLALLATYGLPGLIEAGVFLDVLVLVLLMEGVVVQIRREHDSIEVDRLRELRG